MLFLWVLCFLLFLSTGAASFLAWLYRRDERRTKAEILRLSNMRIMATMTDQQVVALAQLILDYVGNALKKPEWIN